MPRDGTHARMPRDGMHAKTLRIMTRTRRQ
jgi:hypothetical protein